MREVERKRESEGDDVAVAMNGALSLIETAAGAGVEVCFANPGTTEIELVRALDSVPSARAILGLFEGVCTGAADGYGRMTGRPALTILHHGPGFANGIANLHNAARARSPVVNLVGDQASWHREYDPPLTSDITSLARPVSAWVHTATSAMQMAHDMAEAIAVAIGPPGRVATLILPSDFLSDEALEPSAVRHPVSPSPVPAAAIAQIAGRLRSGARAALILGGEALTEVGQLAAARVAAVTDTRLHVEMFPPRWERGAGLPAMLRLPYFPEDAIAALADRELVVLAGTSEPVAFFGYEGLPSRLAPPGSTITLSSVEQDAAGALEALADELNAPDGAGSAATSVPVASSPNVSPNISSNAARKGPPRGAVPTGPLTPDTIGAALANALPEGAIVVDEAISARGPFYEASWGAPRHTLLGVTGGSIGLGLPCATGAAVACPDRRVIAFQADGSALYTLQSLWTQAREGLDVVTLLVSNRSYEILRMELARAGVTELSSRLRALTDLTAPELDWVALARGFGVPGERVETAEALGAALLRAVREPGPRLIEVRLQ